MRFSKIVLYISGPLLATYRPL